MTLPEPADWPVADPGVDPDRDLLRQRAAATPDATAVIDADRETRWTYEEFDRRVSARAATLDRAFGREADSALDGGDRIGLLLDTRIAFAALYFAAARIGVPIVPLNVRLDRETLATQAALADVELVVCGAETEEVATAVAPGEAPVVSVDEPEREEVGSLGRHGSDPAADDSGGVDRSGDRSASGERVVMFTSGTTGEPKGVRLTRENLVASAVGSASRLGVEPDDRWLVCLPMYHMGGLAPLVRSTLYGTTTVVQRSFDADATGAVTSGFEVTGVSLVPTMLRRLLDAGWEPPASLRFVLLGGAPTPAELVDRCESRNVPVHPTYGLTETASQVATATPTEAFEHTGTVGRPLDGTRIRIVDDGASCDPGERGELVVDGPTVTPGYLDDEHTAAAFGPRGLHTGDVGYRDEAGRLWIVGRVDDQIVTGGENVHPARVVDALRDCDGVADAAVVGLPDEEWGERVAALVVPADESLSMTDVRAHVRDRLAAFAVPKTIALADDLPRTASGTVDRERVREILRADGQSV